MKHFCLPFPVSCWVSNVKETKCLRQCRFYLFRSNMKTLKSINGVSNRKKCTFFYISNHLRMFVFLNENDTESEKKWKKKKRKRKCICTARISLKWALFLPFHNNKIKNFIRNQRTLNKKNHWTNEESVGEWEKNCFLFTQTCNEQNVVASRTSLGKYIVLNTFLLIFCFFFSVLSLFTSTLDHFLCISIMCSTLSYLHSVWLLLQFGKRMRKKWTEFPFI